MTHSPTLSIHSITKSYVEGTRPVLSGINLELTPGIMGLLGPNGAGKTSLLRILAGDLDFERGEVRMGDGLRLPGPIAPWLRRIGYLPQLFDFPPRTTGREMMEQAALLLGIGPGRLGRRIAELLERVNLREAANRYAAEYSRGMKQRLGLALALMHDPDVLLLDEPTAGLDPVERLVFRELLTEAGRHHVVIFSTHLTADIERICNVIAILDRGELVYTGTAEALVSNIRGMVVEQRLEAGELEKLTEERRVVAAHREGDGFMARLLWREERSPEGELAKPRLEDAYFALMDGRV